MPASIEEAAVIYGALKGGNVNVSVVLSLGERAAMEDDGILHVGDGKTVSVRGEFEGNRDEYAFDGVHEATSSNREIYESCGFSQIARSFLSRYGHFSSGSIVAYGTAGGPGNLFGSDGSIAHLAMQDIVELMHEKNTTHLFSSRLKLSLSFVEFRGDRNHTFDLLAAADSPCAPSLDLEGSRGRAYVPGVRWVHCQTIEDALKAIQEGGDHRDKNGSNALLSIKMEKFSWESGELEDAGHVDMFDIAETRSGGERESGGGHGGSFLLDMILADPDAQASKDRPSSVNKTLSNLIQDAVGGYRASSVLLSVAPDPDEPARRSESEGQNAQLEGAVGIQDSLFSRMLKSFPARAKKAHGISEATDEVADITMEQEEDMVLLGSSLAKDEGMVGATIEIPSEQTSTVEAKEGSIPSAISNLFRRSSGLGSSPLGSGIGSTGKAKGRTVINSDTDENASAGGITIASDNEDGESTNRDRSVDRNTIAPSVPSSPTASDNEGGESVIGDPSVGGGTIVPSVPSSTVSEERERRDLARDSTSPLSFRGSLFSGSVHLASGLCDFSRAEATGGERGAPDEAPDIGIAAADQVSGDELVSNKRDFAAAFGVGAFERDRSDREKDGLSEEEVEPSASTKATSNGGKEPGDEIPAAPEELDSGAETEAEKSAEGGQKPSDLGVDHDRNPASLDLSDTTDGSAPEKIASHGVLSGDENEIESDAGDVKLEKAASWPTFHAEDERSGNEDGPQPPPTSKLEPRPALGPHLKKATSLPSFHERGGEDTDRKHAEGDIPPTPKKLFAAEVPESGEKAAESPFDAAPGDTEPDSASPEPGGHGSSAFENIGRRLLSSSSSRAGTTEDGRNPPAAGRAPTTAALARRKVRVASASAFLLLLVAPPIAKFFSLYADDREAALGARGGDIPRTSFDVADGGRGAAIDVDGDAAPPAASEERAANEAFGVPPMSPADLSEPAPLSEPDSSEGKPLAFDVADGEAAVDVDGDAALPAASEEHTANEALGVLPMSPANLSEPAPPLEPDSSEGKPLAFGEVARNDADEDSAPAASEAPPKSPADPSEPAPPSGPDSTEGEPVVAIPERTAEPAAGDDGTLPVFEGSDDAPPLDATLASLLEGAVSCLACAVVLGAALTWRKSGGRRGEGGGGGGPGVGGGAAPAAAAPAPAPAPAAAAAPAAARPSTPAKKPLRGDGERRAKGSAGRPARGAARRPRIRDGVDPANVIRSRRDEEFVDGKGHVVYRRTSPRLTRQRRVKRER